MKDKRVAPREALLARAVKTKTTLSDGTVLSGSVHDLSMHGARVLGDTDDLHVDDEITLTLLFPLDQHVQYKCRVRHINPDTDFGVEFVQ